MRRRVPASAEIRLSVAAPLAALLVRATALDYLAAAIGDHSPVGWTVAGEDAIVRRRATEQICSVSR